MHTSFIHLCLNMFLIFLYLSVFSLFSSLFIPLSTWILEEKKNKLFGVKNKLLVFTNTRNY